MRINADFSQRVVVRPEDYRWVGSPMPGVERMMLDRIGDEVARATSLVRYEPNSTFPPHVHGGGEEFFVLEGEFGDEHRAYPVATYVRNPIGTRHAPRVGQQGCVIFVKLHQFDKYDDTPVVIETGSVACSRQSTPGAEAKLSHEFHDERVMLLRWAPHTVFAKHTHHGGAEAYVIDGAFADEYGDYPAGTWLRYPDRRSHTARAGKAGALLYLKTGHLPPPM